MTITPTVQPSPTLTQQCPTEIVYETKTIDRLSECIPVTVTSTIYYTKSDTAVKEQLSSSLGALFGLAIVALAIVTTGWVWSCWIMKKRAGMKVNMEEQVG